MTTSEQQVHTATLPNGDSATLSHAPLDPAAIEASVRSEKDGAVVSFVGYTRDNFQGRTVTHLTYESYIPLALKTLRQLLLEARDLPPPPPLAGIPSHHCASHSHAPLPSMTEPPKIELGRITIAHLLGPSPPLTPSIVISVASPHRREAFYVCEWLLEMVKLRVQVWKREWYAPEEGEGAEGEGSVFVGRDGEGPDGFGGRAHERQGDEGEKGRTAANKWKENFPPPVRVQEEVEDGVVGAAEAEKEG
ncbi:hypothetical protein JCM6882_003884 [Rhodosporidiobolus microsporus]